MDELNETLQAAQDLAAQRTRERMQVLRDWVADPDDATRRRAAREAAHQLSGSLDMFSATGGSAAAARLERMLDPAIITAAQDDPAAVVADLERLTGGLTGAITGLEAPGLVPIHWRAPGLEPPGLVSIDWHGSDRRAVDRSTEFAGVRILAVDDDPSILEAVTRVFTEAGAEVLRATDGREALEIVERQSVDLVVSDVNMPDVSGFALVRALRSRPDTLTLPLLFLTTRGAKDDVVHGLGLGADDYLVKPVDPGELRARASARLARPPSPPGPPEESAPVGLVGAGAFRRVLGRERERARREGTSGSVAVICVAEFDALTRRLGRRTAQDVVAQVAGMVEGFLGPLDVVAQHSDNAIALFLGASDSDDTTRRLEVLTQFIVARRFGPPEEAITLTPAVGWVGLTEVPGARALVVAADIAATHAEARLDLVPMHYTPAMQAAARPLRRSRLVSVLRTPFQFALTLVLGLVIPYVVYAALDDAGFDITGVVYLVVVATLVLTGVLIWWEGILALRPLQPPDDEIESWPRASAIIAAYLPNEAATLLDTLEAFLRVDYPDLQVILAYNTPQSMPIESELRDLARRDPRLVALRVEPSESKAQNVNAALSHVEGEFVGVFDADHHPDPDAFRRAWRWLSSGTDVVQGHNVVRNGSASFVARIVAVEFEAIYAVSHPGRNRLHDFGIFGGSNGYWRTDLLRATRMQGSMLTEDIDSSIRAVEGGHVIVSDPGIKSRELATTTVGALWNQRMRWSQGWFQVSLRHTWRALRSKQLSFRQKLGVFHLLAWREVYPWLSLQMIPILAYWLVGSGRSLDWTVPVFVLTTLFIVSVGPGQALFAYLVGDPEVRKHRSWFWIYLVFASLLYTEFKNTIARVAQIKELMGERDWRVTPRTPESPPTPG